MGQSSRDGEKKSDIFYENGLRLTKASNDREAGWLSVKELLKTNSNGESRLKIFSNCRELIKCLPALIVDKRHPTDCATEPHEITHAPDALRYFSVYWIRPSDAVDESRVYYPPDMLEDLYNAKTELERQAIYRRMGGKPK